MVFFNQERNLEIAELEFFGITELNRQRNIYENFWDMIPNSSYDSYF